MKSFYTLFLTFLVLLTFNQNTSGQGTLRLKLSIKTPTCNEADGAIVVTDSLNPLFLNGFSLYRMPGMVLVGQGNSFSGLSQGKYLVRYTTQWSTLYETTFLTNFPSLYLFDSLRKYDYEKCLFLMAFISGIKSDTCNLSKGSVSIGANWSQPFLDTLNKINWTWSNGQSGLKATNLKAGVRYWVKGSFGNGCRYFIPHTFQDSFCIEDPNSPVPNWNCYDNLSINEDTLFFFLNNANTLNVEIEVLQKPFCSSSSGIIKAVVVEPFTPPLAFRWNTNEISEQLSNLISESYEVTVVDNQGCLGKANLFLQSDFPPDFQTTTSILKMDSCNLGIGKVSATVFGGFPPYTYQWNLGSPNSQSTFNQAKGTTFLKIRDSNGCEISKMIYVSNKNPLVNFKTGALPDCGSGTGKITIQTSGGVLPYSYEWIGYPQNFSNVLDSIPRGHYFFKVNDANGCNMTDYHMLEVPPSCLHLLNLSFYRKDDNNCSMDGAEPGIYGNAVTYNFFNQTYYRFSKSTELNILISKSESDITVQKREAFLSGCLNSNWTIPEIIFPPSANHSEKEIGLSYEGNVKNIKLTAFSQPFRPGFNCQLSLNVTNIGNQLTEATSIKFTLPEEVQYMGGSNQIQVVSPNTITIPIPDLKLGEQKTYFILVKPNENLALGVLKKFIFDADTLFAETDLEDNRQEINLKTVGSFDPNDISVSPSPIITPRKQNLTYRIRFQNLGTYFAENVVIKDTLPEEIDVKSFRPIASSHIFNQSISIKGRELTIKYLGITLPPAIWNWEKSIGFFEFEINRKPDLHIGTLISNSASIYFDFNEPVKTNTAEVEVNINRELLLEPLNIYPNPSSEYFQISPSFYNEIQVFDLIGKIVTKLLPDDLGRYHINAFPQGLYLIKTEGKTGRVLINR